VIAYAIHILEEHELNWRGWARQVLRLPVDWPTFYLVNALVIVVGISCAVIGWQEAWFALAFPAAMLINATVFHVAPTMITRVYSPGVASAVLIFYPVALWAYYAAWLDGALTVTTGIISGAVGAALMATPVVLLKLKHWKVFSYGEGQVG
jgi:hypothetical protein